MLKGTVKFNYVDANGAPFVETFDVIGVDTSATCLLKISTNSYRAIEVMAGDSDDDNALWSRRVNVGINSISVERKVFTDSAGKVTSKLDYNYDFFLSLAALIRYSKSQCKQSNATDYTGFQSASGEYIPETCQEFNIPDADGNIIGTVVLEYGEIKAISVRNMWFDVNLHTDATEYVPVFEKITNSPPKVFKLDREYLGFNPIGVFNESDMQTLSGMYRDMAEVIAAHPEKELAWLLEKNYVIVDDTMLDELIDKFMSVPDDDFVYCDTETTGLNINFKSRIGQADQCVGLILSVDDGESFYFPMQMKSIPNLCGGDHWFFMSRVKGILESKKLVGHNSPFDWKVCYIYDINANFVEDTMAMIALTIGAEKENYPLGLKDNTAILLKRDSLELSDLVKNNEWGESDIKFWDLPAELVRYYACADTDNTRGIFKYVMDNDLLQKYNATRVYRIEVVFGLAVAYQEFYGHRVDVKELEALKSEIDADLKSNMDKMVEIVGYEFNPNSPKQLVKIMYEELGIPEQRDRKTGRLSTSKEVLGYLAGLTDINDKPKYPFVGYLKKYREAEGVRKIMSQFSDLATNDGFLFSHVMQYGTTTGRVSINTPNYQSYNDAVKKYIRPREGYYMADTDYSSVEYRVTGNMSGNEMIKQGFYDPDFDYHTYQAARMYGVPYATVTPELRKTAKGFNFGIPYGMGNESLGVRIFGEASEENTRKAAELHKKYFAGGQEDVEFFFENARDKAVANGYTETYFGRRRYYYRNKFSIPAIRRQAGNAIIQGTAADIYKLAVGRVFLRVCKEGWLGKVLFPGFIHDELLLEIHNSIDPMVFLKALREEFEVKIEGWCPLYMGFGFGMSWYQAKKTELPIQLQWELVDKYGTEGYPNWHGDGYELCNDIDDILRDFSVRHVANSMQLPEAQGLEIKPALNSSLVSVLKEDAGLYSNVAYKFLEERGIPIKDGDTKLSLEQLETMDSVQEVLKANKNDFVSALNKVYISTYATDDSGNICLDYFKANGIKLKSKKDTIETQLAIDVFCKMHCVDRSNINLLSIDTSAAANSASKLESDESLTFSDDDDSDDNLAVDRRVDTLGMYLDTENSIVILKLVPTNYMEYIKQRTNTEGKGYRIRFKDVENKKLYETQAYLASEEVQTIQQMYIMYFKSMMQCKEN